MAAGAVWNAKGSSLRYALDDDADSGAISNGGSTLPSTVILSLRMLSVLSARAQVADFAQALERWQTPLHASRSLGGGGGGSKLPDECVPDSAAQPEDCC